MKFYGVANSQNETHKGVKSIRTTQKWLLNALRDGYVPLFVSVEK